MVNLPGSSRRGNLTRYLRNWRSSTEILFKLKVRNRLILRPWKRRSSWTFSKWEKFKFDVTNKLVTPTHRKTYLPIIIGSRIAILYIQRVPGVEARGPMSNKRWLVCFGGGENSIIPRFRVGTSWILYAVAMVTVVGLWEHGLTTIGLSVNKLFIPSCDFEPEDILWNIFDRDIIRNPAS